jgi:hypothetical protein
MGEFIDFGRRWNGFFGWNFQRRFREGEHARTHRKLGHEMEKNVLGEFGEITLNCEEIYFGGI